MGEATAGLYVVTKQKADIFSISDEFHWNEVLSTTHQSTWRLWIKTEPKRLAYIAYLFSFPFENCLLLHVYGLQLLILELPFAALKIVDKYKSMTKKGRFNYQVCYLMSLFFLLRALLRTIQSKPLVATIAPKTLKRGTSNGPIFCFKQSSFHHQFETQCATMMQQVADLREEPGPLPHFKVKLKPAGSWNRSLSNNYDDGCENVT